MKERKTRQDTTLSIDRNTVILEVFRANHVMDFINFESFATSFFCFNYDKLG